VRWLIANDNINFPGKETASVAPACRFSTILV